MQWAGGDRAQPGRHKGPLRRRAHGKRFRQGRNSRSQTRQLGCQLQGRSGSTANFGSLRSVLFQRQTEAGIAVKLVKANYAPNNQEICTLVWNDLLGGFDVGEALPPEKKPPSGSNQKKIFELLPDDGSWISQKKVQRTLEMKADRFAHARMGLIKRGCLEVSTDGQQMRGLFDGAD